MATYHLRVKNDTINENFNPSFALVHFAEQFHETLVVAVRVGVDVEVVVVQSNDAEISVRRERVFKLALIVGKFVVGQVGVAEENLKVNRPRLAFPFGITELQ